MSGQFRVQPDVIERAGSEMMDHADRLESSISTFSGAAEVGDAFGVLPEAGDAASQYAGMLQDAIDKLRQLERTVALTGRGLQKTASNYRKADADSTMHGG